MNNTEIFKPENLTISDIFTFTGIYSIPNYQRQYTWGDEQLEELWSDLYNSFINDTDECYFLGSIVVVDNKTGEHELVDGQQRITTLMIMLNILYKKFPDINKDNTNILKADKSWLSNLIYFNKSINRLKLQQDPDYDTDFDKYIIKDETYDGIKKPTKEELKKEEPKYKFINTAYFFLNKFNELVKNDKNSEEYAEQYDDGNKLLSDFVNYILFKTNIRVVRKLV